MRVDRVRPDVPSPSGVYDYPPIEGAHRWRDLGVPYTIEGPLMIWGQSALLTIDPGVEMRFRPGAFIGAGMRSGFMGTPEVSASGGGSLFAEGTPTEPIVFTADTTGDVPGYWGGIVFDDVVDPASSLRYVQMYYGASAAFGAPRAAAIRVRGDVRGQFIRGTWVMNSGACGIARDRLGGPAFTVSFTTIGLGNIFQGNTADECQY